MQDFIKIKQQLEILWGEVERLEREGGGGDDSYTKAQTDALLAEKADKSTTYTKTQVDGEILGAINDLDVSSTSATGHYIKSIAQENGKIVPVAETVDTEPIVGSTKPITSGGVYTALQNLPTGGGIETVKLNKSGNFVYWPEDKMSILDTYDQFVYIENANNTNKNLCFITHDVNTPTAKVVFQLQPYTFSNAAASLHFVGFSVDTSTRKLTYGGQYDVVDNYNILSNVYNPIGIVINANTDLDTLSVVGGKYYCTSTNAATLTNCPTTDAFNLYIEHTTALSVVAMTQKIITCDTIPTIFIRTRNGSSSWNSWYKFEGTVVS